MKNKHTLHAQCRKKVFPKDSTTEGLFEAEEGLKQ
jgi:hypothetical protein